MITPERLVWLFELYIKMQKFNQKTTGIINLDREILLYCDGVPEEALEQVVEVSCYCGGKYVSRVSVKKGWEDNLDAMSLLDKCPKCGYRLPMSKGITWLRIKTWTQT